MDPDDHRPFPLMSFLGFELVDLEPGHVVARIEITEQLLNPNGAVHGGVLFTMIDTAMGKATMAVLEDGQLCATIEVQIRFLRPVLEGTLEADVTVIRRGRRIVHLEARVRDDSGALVATGAGTFAVVVPFLRAGDVV